MFSGGKAVQGHDGTVVDIHHRAEARLASTIDGAGWCRRNQRCVGNRAERAAVGRKGIEGEEKKGDI